MIRILAPHRYHGAWACEYEVRGLSFPIRERLIGEDSLQALFIALQSLSQGLQVSAAHLTWLDGPPGAIGIPFIMLFSNELNKELEDQVKLAMVEHELRLAENANRHVAAWRRELPARKKR